jgi:uncharacterized coiled-coil protein SlyX
MFDALLLLTVRHTTPFFEGTHFWEGAAAAAVVGGFLAQWVFPPLKKWWRKRRDRNLFMDGKKAVPNVSDVILSAAERITELDVELKSQHDEIDKHTVTLKEQSVTLRSHGNLLVQIVELLGNIDKTTMATNERVADNGGDTSSLADVVQRVAKKMKVYDISATATTNPSTGEEVVTDLHATSHIPEVA